MKSYDDAAAAVLDAIEPVAAYLERTTARHAHAQALETLLHAVADLGEAADAQLAGPDWEHIALRMAGYVGTPAPPSALVVRVRAHLAQPHLVARAALPLAQRMALATLNSHHLGIPDYLRERDQSI